MAPSGTSTPLNGRVTKGTATPGEPVEMNTLPPVVGINFGNSYASIAVFTKEGHAESIANEDGERQIACAVAFQGEEIYIGNGAKQQLVKNSKNTILGFRNLLGKKFSEIPQTQSSTSAPVIQHPTIPDEPAYTVEVLAPPPKPLIASSAPASKINTPASEPSKQTRTLTVSEVTSMFLKSLCQSAEDFLGKPIQCAVITVPAWFGDKEREALEKAAEDAGLPVKQLLDESGAAVATTTSDAWSFVEGEDSSALLPDRTQLVIDVGASATNLSLLSIREGLAYVLSTSTSPHGADQIDDKLIKHFGAEFTKKTRIPLTIAPSTSPTDARAEAKLRLAIEHTKRTISASPGAATCSVESLKEGMDFTGSINRMRFDMVASTIYGKIAESVVSLLAEAGVDAHEVDEIVYVGGTASLPGLDEHVVLAGGFKEDVTTPFARGTVIGGGIGDPTSILARGCAIQAALLHSLADTEENKEIIESFHRSTKANQVQATTRTLGLLFPSNREEDQELGGVWVPVVRKETALPVRRILQFEVALGAEKRVAAEVWEVKEGIRVERVALPPLEDDSDTPADDEDEPEHEEIKHQIISKEFMLASLELVAKLGLKQKGKAAKKEFEGLETTMVKVTFIVSLEGALDVEISEVGEGGAVQRVHVPAA
ncbi:dnaK-type molecular chaperone bipA [Coprinopsis sp. MPI-PUGE-AT-0042]|nr:dnaK-type molecular chaperone bipA [Coprinopsis sp. MPI-PUGE-AT-0042]